MAASGAHQDRVDPVIAKADLGHVPRCQELAHTLTPTRFLRELLEISRWPRQLVVHQGSRHRKGPVDQNPWVQPGLQTPVTPSAHSPDPVSELLPSDQGPVTDIDTGERLPLGWVHVRKDVQVRSHPCACSDPARRTVANCRVRTHCMPAATAVRSCTRTMHAVTLRGGHGLAAVAQLPRLLYASLACSHQDPHPDITGAASKLAVQSRPVLSACHG